MYKTAVIAAKLAKHYYDRCIPIEIGYKLLDNNWQCEFRVSYTKNGSLINYYIPVSLEFIEVRDAFEVVEGLLAMFETVREGTAV